MKLIIIAFAFVAMVACAEVQQDFFCSSDAECDNGCCMGFMCQDFVEEGDLCTIRGSAGCGCRPGLDCEKSGWFLKRCKDNNPGSGGF